MDAIQSLVKVDVGVIAYATRPSSMKQARVVLVLLDGLRFDIAQTHMGYMSHLVECQQASLYKVQSELPTLSRPLYEVLLTGVKTSESGITANEVVRLSTQVSVFHLAAQQGLTTAAAAYSWFSELYNTSPFDPFTDREQHNLNLPIQHGKFYWSDDYPDSHLFADAEMLRLSRQPDFILVHPMGIDHAGHSFGAEAPEYRNKVAAMDSLLAQYVPRWLAAGYTLVITADHGMNADKNHGGSLPDVREVPMFCIGREFKAAGMYLEDLTQVAIAPLLCRLLNLPLTKAMQDISIPGFSPQVSLPSQCSHPDSSQTCQQNNVHPNPVRKSNLL